MDDIGVDHRLLAAQRNLDHTKNSLVDGMVKLVGRGETTSELVTMAEDVERSSHLFADEAEKYSPKTCCQKCTQCLFWVFPCIILLRRCCHCRCFCLHPLPPPPPGPHPRPRPAILVPDDDDDVNRSHN